MTMRIRKTSLLSGAVIVAGLWATSAAAAPVTVYSNDFDGGLSVLGGVTAVLSGITTTESVQSLPAQSRSPDPSLQRQTDFRTSHAEGWCR